MFVRPKRRRPARRKGLVFLTAVVGVATITGLAIERPTLIATATEAVASGVMTGARTVAASAVSLYSWVSEALDRGQPDAASIAAETTVEDSDPAAERTDQVIASNQALLDEFARRARADAATTDVESTDSPTLADAEHVVTVRRGDTLLALLMGNNVPRPDAHAAVTALRTVFDPRKLRVGQHVTLRFTGSASGPQFRGLDLQPDVTRLFAVESMGAGNFSATELKKDLDRRMIASTGTITSSLFEAGAAANVPISVMMQLIKIFSHDVDFQRDLKAGDDFALLFERFETDHGDVARHGDIVFAALTLDGTHQAVYRFTPEDGRTDFFNSDGESIRKALLRTPIDGARISSGYGMRRHPILGYSKMHRGIDFAAPRGTPIFAAGDGVIREIGRKGSFGNYLRIQHNSEISTAYAHLNGFAKGLRRGARVRQGQVVAYVGSTGRSTGPHLHYEVLRQGRQVNPLSIDLPVGQKLQGRQLDAFRIQRDEIDRQFRSTQGSLHLAGFNGRQTVEAAATDTDTVCPSESGC